MFLDQARPFVPFSSSRGEPATCLSLDLVKTHDSGCSSGSLQLGRWPWFLGSGLAFGSQWRTGCRWGRLAALPGLPPVRCSAKPLRCAPPDVNRTTEAAAFPLRGRPGLLRCRRSRPRPIAISDGLRLRVPPPATPSPR